MNAVSLSAAQKAKQSLVRKLSVEQGFVGAGIDTDPAGRYEIVVVLVEAACPAGAKVPSAWRGVPVRTEVGGTPRKFSRKSRLGG